MRTPAVLRHLALLFTLSELPALAQDTVQPVETVEVTANALVGVWKIGFPQYGRISPFHPPVWGATQPNFCRIEQAGANLTANCFPGPGIDGTATVESTHFHMAWGTMMARIVIDGTLQSGTKLAAHFAIKLSGLAVENPNVSDGEKLTLSPGAPDKGGKSALLVRLLGEMALGPPAESFDMKPKHIQLLKPESLRPLGAVQTIIYLGVAQVQINDHDPPVFADFYGVYDIEFANGHRLCGLHQREDGVLDGFRCV